MKKPTHTLLLLLLAGTAPLMSTSRAAPGMPAPTPAEKLAGAAFSEDGKLQRPVDYRSWRFVTSGLGMTYGPVAKAAAATGHTLFDNVFVQPQAYDAFLRDGVWPEGTMFVLELRGTETNRPPNNSGNFQTELHGIEVSVKDSSRFKGRWAYFDFGMQTQSASPQPESGCFACHLKNTAVDMTFVQFYPTLQNTRAP